MIYLIISLIAGYLIGSVSVSVLVCKCFYHEDVRKKGSGNAGATNAARVFGPVAGILTFLGDFLKCIAAMLLGKLLGGDYGMVIGGIGCLLGHCFPLYFHFRGGKAVSTAAAVALMLDWHFAVIGLAAFLVIVLLTKRVSIASIVTSLCLPAAAIILSHPTSHIVLSCFTCALLIFMHRENIKRIVDGTEAAFSFGNSKKEQE